MKRILLNILFFTGLAVGFTACEKEEIRAVLNPGAAPEITVSASSLTLTKENEEQTALTVSWTKPDYGFSAGVQYRLMIDKVGNNFATPQVFATGNELSKSWTHKQLNGLLQAMGYKGEEMADLDIAVESILSDDVVQRSVALKLSAMGYLDKLDLSSPWGVVGSAAANGWDGPDMPFYQTGAAGVFVAYVTLKDGEMKIRQNNDWAVNYGDDGANGTLELNGGNIAVKAGTYQITFNSNDLTYKLEALSWGLVGSATPNGWDGPDFPFTYDPSSDQWRAITKLVDGEMKIRKNNDWGVNYGDDGNNGSLELNGANIAVKAGTYLVTFNTKEFTYTIEPISIPGIVGSSAPNGWDGPDVQLKRDFSKDGFWYANGVKLAAGEIKFRMNNDWALNYGDDGADGKLEVGGANIVVKAGTYNVELDLSDAGPTYKLTAK
ncbi:SusE outer membrane protein [Spirosomataceae bacterium TFI 002]|nr:SusE outer membrane protein [Spirosomataceae bacterium TFI 002]